MDLFYTIVQYNQRLKAHITKMSYVEFRKYFAFGITMCLFMWLIVLWQCVDVLSVVDRIWYLSGCVVAVFLSYIAMDIYVQNTFRNLIGIVLSSVVYPNVMRYIMWKMPMVAIDSFILAMLILSHVALVALWCYTINWSLYIGIAKHCGVWSVMKFCFKRIPREYQLSHNLTQWDKSSSQSSDTIPHICLNNWWNSTAEERVMQIQHVVAYEAAVMNLNDTVSIVARSYGRMPYWEFNCDVNFVRQHIVWESDAVKLCHPYEILADLLLALQQIKWYQLQDTAAQQIIYAEHTQENDDGRAMSSCSDSKTARLLFEQFKGEHGTLVYDILTGSYARARSDWYCGF